MTGRPACQCVSCLLGSAPTSVGNFVAFYTPAEQKWEEKHITAEKKKQKATAKLRIPGQPAWDPSLLQRALLLTFSNKTLLLLKIKRISALKTQRVKIQATD